MGAEGITIGGASMWALLRDEEPGHSTTVIDNRKHKKDAAAAVSATDDITEVEEAPAADNVRLGRGGAKSEKRGKKTKTTKKKKGTTGDNKRLAATVDDGEVRINGHKEKQTSAAPLSELEKDMSDGEEEEMTGEVATGGSRCRTVASRMFRAALAVALLALYCQLASGVPAI